MDSIEWNRKSGTEDLDSKQRPHTVNHKVLLSGAFYVKRIEIFSSATLKIRTN